MDSTGETGSEACVKNCVTCRRLEGLPYSSYIVPDLPSIRVSEDPPFTHTGVDFAGPLFVRGNSTTESDNNNCYVCFVYMRFNKSCTPRTYAKSYCLSLSCWRFAALQVVGDCLLLQCPIMEIHSKDPPKRLSRLHCRRKSSIT